MALHDLDKQAVIWPNKWYADPLIISILLLMAGLVIVAFFLLRTEHPLRDLAVLVPVLLFSGILLLAGGLWLSQVLNASISATSKGLILRNVSGKRIDIPWERIQTVFWREDTEAGEHMAELEYTDAAGIRRGLGISPRAHRNTRRVKRLCDHIIQHSGLEEIGPDGAIWVRAEKERT